MCSCSLLTRVVDLLRSAGLRNNNLPPSDATATNGPSGALDALMLQKELTAATSGVEWELIGAQLPSEFSVYTVFDTVQYTGSILSVTSGNNVMPVLDITLQRPVGLSDFNTLNITLPGLSPITVDVLAASGAASFQYIGISLKGSLLVVLLNCSIVDIVTLQGVPDKLPVADGMVAIFGSQAIVSVTFSYSRNISFWFCITARHILLPHD